MTSGRSVGARWLVIALVAALGLTLSVSVAAGAGAKASRGAVVAKKKCKKKKKGVTAAKKKKCKKKHVLSLPGPIVRATISWSSSGQVDLHAFDASGNRSGIVLPCSTPVCPISEGIPNATHSPDVAGGSETFTDNIFVRGGTANREFGYAICFYDNASVTFTGVNALGQSQTLPINGLANQGHSVTLPNGPQVPASFNC